MRILLTGASSFTGTYFCQALTARGHEVVLTSTQSSLEDYAGLRHRRFAPLAALHEVAWSCPFGGEAFLELVASRSWDVFCHHAADVREYRSPDFDVAAAVSANTHNVRDSLRALKEGGCSKLVVTGSIFEGGEGSGSEDLPHFSPYGLSKSLTWQVFEYWARVLEMGMGKFVIPNPFGALEEPRFVSYLMSTWGRGESATVQTPDYVRDNIAVDLLALDYAHLVETLDGAPGVTRLNPSGFVGPQGEFAQLVAREMRARLGWECALGETEQTSFAEPMVRVNTQPSVERYPSWSEAAFWDAMADFYRGHFGLG